MSEYVIVSRHPAAVQFVREELGLGEDVPVLATADAANVRDKVVAGNIPLHLACLCRYVVAVEFDTPPRGAEYTLEDMRRAGAHLKRYRVTRIG